MKIKLIYPIITFESKIIDVTDEIGEELFESATTDEKAKFIYDNMDESDVEWLPYGKKGLVDALDIGYASVKKINNLKPQPHEKFKSRG